MTTVNWLFLSQSACLQYCSQNLMVQQRYNTLLFVFLHIRLYYAATTYRLVKVVTLNFGCKSLAAELRQLQAGLKSWMNETPCSQHPASSYYFRRTGLHVNLATSYVCSPVLVCIYSHWNIASSMDHTIRKPWDISRSHTAVTAGPNDIMYF